MNQILQIYLIVLIYRTDKNHVMLLLYKPVESYPSRLHYLLVDFDLKLSLISRFERYHIDPDLMDHYITHFMHGII